MMRKLISLVLALSMVFMVAGASVSATSVTTANTTTTGVTATYNETTYMKEVAQVLLNNTESILKIVEAKLPAQIPNDTKEMYTEAVQLLNKAQLAYKGGNYTASIQYSLQAMHEFKKVLQLEYQLQEKTQARNQTALQETEMVEKEVMRAETFMKIAENYMRYALALGEKYNDTKIMTQCAEMQDTLAQLQNAVKAQNTTQIEKLTKELKKQMDELRKQVELRNREIIRERAMMFSKQILMQLNQTIAQLQKTNPEMAKDLMKEYQDLQEKYKHGDYLQVVVKGQYFHFIKRKICMPPMYAKLLVHDHGKISPERLQMVISLEKTALLQLALQGENVTDQYHTLALAEEYIEKAKTSKTNETQYLEEATKLLAQVAEFLQKQEPSECHVIVVPVKPPVQPQPIPPWEIIHEEHKGHHGSAHTSEQNQTTSAPVSNSTMTSANSTQATNSTAPNSTASSDDTHQEHDHEGGSH